MSLALAFTLASCKKEDVGPTYQVIPEEKGAPAVNADAGWEQVANLGFKGSGNQYKFIGISEREGYIMAAIQSGFQSQQDYIYSSQVGYIDADGFFRATVQPPGSYMFSYQRAEPLANYSLGNSNYFSQGRPFSMMLYNRTTAGNTFNRLTHNGAKTFTLDIGYGNIYDAAFCAMPFNGPITTLEPGNTAYYAYSWLSGAILRPRIIEYSFRATSYDVPITLTANQSLNTTLVSENERKLHMVYIRRTQGVATELIHFTKLPNVAPVLEGTVTTTALPDSAACDLFYQGGKLVVCGRYGGRAVFVDALTGTGLADISVQRNLNNSPLVSAALMPDGTPVIGFSDPSVGDKLTVLRCSGTTGTPLGKVGLTNGATGCGLYTLKGALYAGIVNQEARSLAIIKLKQ